MGEPLKVLITKCRSPLMGENTLVIAISISLPEHALSQVKGGHPGVSSMTPSLLPFALNACHAGYAG